MLKLLLFLPNVLLVGKQNNLHLLNLCSVNVLHLYGWQEENISNGKIILIFVVSDRQVFIHMMAAATRFCDKVNKMWKLVESKRYLMRNIYSNNECIYTLMHTIFPEYTATKHAMIFKWIHLKIYLGQT